MGSSFTAFTEDGEEQLGANTGSGGGGGGPTGSRRGGGGGGGGGLRLPLNEELEGTSISGDGGGGNSGEVEEAGGGLSVEAWEAEACGESGGASVPALELGGRGGGNGGGWLRGVLGAEEEEKHRGGGGGGGGPELFSESEVLEEREVEDEETDTEDRRDDFLSGTFGLGRPPGGDMDLSREGTGVPAVGVLDWLE